MNMLSPKQHVLCACHQQAIESIKQKKLAGARGLQDVINVILQSFSVGVLQEWLELLPHVLHLQLVAFSLWLAGSALLNMPWKCNEICTGRWYTKQVGIPYHPWMHLLQVLHPINMHLLQRKSD